MKNKVLESTKRVVEQSKSVHINEKKALEFARSFTPSKQSYWLAESPVSLGSLKFWEKQRLCVLLASQNFCYWGDPKWAIEYNGKPLGGFYSMTASFMRAITEGKPILDFDYCSRISESYLKLIWRANTLIPLFPERVQIVQEIGKKMAESFHGSVRELVEQSGFDALKLLETIETTFPSFEDSSTYQGRRVHFLKRAQLLVRDLSELNAEKEGVPLKQSDQLTGFADYKTPQMLRKLGVLEYSKTLAQKIDDRIEIPKDSEEEIEIRANTIWAIEAIKQEVRQKYPGVTSPEIDEQLWLSSQTKQPGDKPYHRTRTTSY